MHKYIVLLTLILLGSSLAVLGQECVETPNGVSTDPDNPQNANCNDVLFLNDFDWRATNYDIGVGTVPSPFENNAAVDISYLWDAGTYPFSARDYEPEDGWELIRFQPGADSYLVLYNKYTSILRVLFLITQTQDNYDFVSAELKFDPPATNGGAVTALLHPTSGRSQPLDRTSTGATKSVVQYTNNDNLFMHTDIPVEYDPCTCVGEATTLSIKFKQVNEMKLDLYGRYIEIEENLASVVGGSGPFNKDFLTQAYYVDDPENIAGAHTFKSWEELVGHYKYLKSIKSELEDKYRFYKAFGEIAGLATKAPFFKKYQLSNEVFGSKKTYEVLDFVAAGVKLLGAPLKKKVDDAGKAVSQMGATNFSHGEIALSGSITDDSPVGAGINFYLPGGPVANQCSDEDPQLEPELYPRYNEVLGRFALLETPRLLHEQVVYEIFDLDDYGYPEREFVVRSSRLKLDPESIKYVFNPALNLSSETEIWASLQFTTVIENPSDPSPPSSFLNNLTEVERGNGVVVWSTPLMPLGALSEFVSSLILIEGDLRPEVELTLGIEFVYDDLNSEGEKNKAIQFYSYPVNVDLPTILEEETHSPEFGATPDYPDELTLGDTNFTENTTLFAWTNIYIEGNITTDPGVQVNIIAPNIELLSGGWVSPEIDLYSEFTPFDFEPIEPVERQDVITFCQDRYQADNASPQFRSETAVPMKTKSALELESNQIGFFAELTPNPVGSDNANLLINNDQSDYSSAAVYDLNGRQLYALFSERWLEKGVHQFPVPTTNLKPGTYFIRLESAQGNQVVRFVK